MYDEGESETPITLNKCTLDGNLMEWPYHYHKEWELGN